MAIHEFTKERTTEIEEEEKEKKNEINNWKAQKRQIPLGRLVLKYSFYFRTLS